MGGVSYTALDFETANSDRTSICSVGLARVENGRIVAKVHQLINPCAPFQYWNTKVHGITAADVRNAPTFAEYWDEISGFFSDYVVAHNAAFDISCLKSSIEHYGLDYPHFDYFCTLCMSRKKLRLPSNKLDDVARYFNLPAFNHHNALDDAVICAKIFHRLADAADLDSFKKSFAAHKVSVSGQRPKPATFARAKITPRADVFPPDNDTPFDFSPIDFSKTFLVVGKFCDMTLPQVESLVLRAGGGVVRSIDEYPDYVVVGARQDISTPSGEFPDAVYTAYKARIPVISESHFLSCVSLC